MSHGGHSGGVRNGQEAEKLRILRFDVPDAIVNENKYNYIFVNKKPLKLTPSAFSQIFLYIKEKKKY